MNRPRHYNLTRHLPRPTEAICLFGTLIFLVVYFAILGKAIKYHNSCEYMENSVASMQSNPMENNEFNFEYNRGVLKIVGRRDKK